MHADIAKNVQVCRGTPACMCFDWCARKKGLFCHKYLLVREVYKHVVNFNTDKCSIDAIKEDYILKGKSATISDVAQDEKWQGGSREKQGAITRGLAFRDNFRRLTFKALKSEVSSWARLINLSFLSRCAYILPSSSCGLGSMNKLKLSQDVFRGYFKICLYKLHMPEIVKTGRFQIFYFPVSKRKIKKKNQLF